MKFILVDDERLALLGLERQLRKFDTAVILGTFIHAQEALEAELPEAPDAIFLDIDMPGMSGLEAAVHMQDRWPEAAVVFVTAHEEYAVKAFEIEAVDYLMKPAGADRLAQTMKRLEARAAAAYDAQAEQPEAETVIRCFQSMQIDIGGGATVPWRTAKTQELFAYLVLRREQHVRKDTLLDTLWPDSPPVKSKGQLYTTVYQLRKSLEQAGLPIRLLNNGVGYRLHTGSCRIDTDMWEDSLTRHPEVTAETLELQLELLKAYRGDYFAEENYWWAEKERERLQALWYDRVIRTGAYLEECSRMADALSLYNRAGQLLPYSEDNHLRLMRLYARMQLSDSVDQQYRTLAAMLREEFDIEPSIHVTEWYETWSRERALPNIVGWN